MENLFTNLVFSHARSWRVLRHSLFWAVWITFLGWANGEKMSTLTTRTMWDVNAGYIVAGGALLLYLPCKLFFTYTLLYGLVLPYLLHRQYARFFAGALAVALGTAALSLPVTLYLITPLRSTFGFPPLSITIMSSFSASLHGENAIFGFALGLKLLKLWYEKQRDNQILVQKNLEAELGSLKAQIHPHFLFNTLNSLYALTLRASPDAPEAVLRLSAMLRTMLYDGTAPSIPLRTELELIRNYIELERLRFGSRVDVSLAWNNADTESFVIAPFVLLPFVENAFKHGVSTTSDTAWISIETSIKSQELTFRLVNSKQECAQAASQPLASGLGLANVRKRLALLYGERFRLRTNDEGETFVVALTLELEPNTAHTARNHEWENNQKKDEEQNHALLTH